MNIFRVQTKSQAIIVAANESILNEKFNNEINFPIACLNIIYYLFLNI